MGGYPFSHSPQSNWEPLLTSLSLLVRPVVYIQSFTPIGATKKQRPRQPAGERAIGQKTEAYHKRGLKTRLRWRHKKYDHARCLLLKFQVGLCVCACMLCVCACMLCVCVCACEKARTIIPQKQGLAINLKAHFLWPISLGKALPPEAAPPTRANMWVCGEYYTSEL